MSRFIPSSDQLAEALHLKGQLDQLMNLLQQHGDGEQDQYQLAAIGRMQSGLGHKIDLLGKLRQLNDSPMQKAAGIPGIRPAGTGSLARKHAPTAEPVPEPEAPEPEVAAGLQLSATLGKGGDAIASGEQVELLQHLLLNMGFKLAPNGSFDIATVQAVRNLQLKAKLPVTSLVDAKTRQFLNPRLAAWKQQLGARLGKPEAELTLADLAAAASRRGEAARPEKPAELVYGPPGQHAISEAAEIALINRVLLGLNLACGSGNKYDAQTYTGVRSFQARNKLRVTGLCDPATYAALQQLDTQQQAAGDMVDALMRSLHDHAEAMGIPGSPLKWKIISLHLEADRQSLQSPLPPRETPLDELPASPEAERPLLSSELGTKGQAGIVSQGLEVERLQEVLIGLGYEIHAPGHFDLQTYGEVKRFQQANGLTPSGLADAPTRAAINLHLEQRYAQERFHDGLIQAWREYLIKAAVPVSAQRWDDVLLLCRRLVDLLAADPEDLAALQRLGLPPRLSEELAPGKAPELQVLLLQLLLSRQGHELELTANYDAATTAAVRGFQGAHKLPMTGRVDGRTRDALNQPLDEQSLDEFQA